MTLTRWIQAGLLVLVLIYPVLTGDSPVWGRLGALVLLAAIGASAWNIVGGYAGQVSVGHAVFFGVGAYSAVTAFVHLGLPPIVGAPVGMLLSVLIAAVIGVPTLRLSGHYFSMATIAVAELAFLLGLTWWIEHSRMGFYLRAIKDSERAARSLGVSSPHYKLYAYMLSAAFTSLAGSLYLCMFGFVDPESGFGILISVKMLVMPALGGAGHLSGPLLA